MFSILKKPQGSPLKELSLKQREMLLAYSADITRREWPSLREILHSPPPDAPPNSPSNSAAPRVRGEWT